MMCYRNQHDFQNHPYIPDLEKCGEVCGPVKNTSMPCPCWTQATQTLCEHCLLLHQQAGVENLVDACQLQHKQICAAKGPALVCVAAQPALQDGCPCCEMHPKRKSPVDQGSCSYFQPFFIFAHNVSSSAFSTYPWLHYNQQTGQCRRAFGEVFQCQLVIQNCGSRRPAEHNDSLSKGLLQSVTPPQRPQERSFESMHIQKYWALILSRRKLMSKLKRSQLRDPNLV